MSTLRGMPGCLLCLLLLLGCSGAETPTPTPGYFLTFTPTPQPTKTAEQAAEQVKQMMASSPEFVASQHIARGSECAVCHDPFPPTASPKESTCLACHGGSEAKLAAFDDQYKYHTVHLGVIACADCHTAHGPYEVKCLICHPACTLH